MNARRKKFLDRFSSLSQLFSLDRLNAHVDATNSFLRMQVVEGEKPDAVFSDSNVLLVVPKRSTSGIGGTYRGLGFDTNDPDAKFLQQDFMRWDFITYPVTLSIADGTFPAFWTMAWGGDDHGSGNQGPIAQIRSGHGLYFYPTAGSWMFFNYCPIDPGAEATPTAEAYRQLLAAYPNQ